MLVNHFLGFSQGTFVPLLYAEKGKGINEDLFMPAYSDIINTHAINRRGPPSFSGFSLFALALLPLLLFASSENVAILIA